MHGLLKVFLLDDLTYRALWAELPHLNSLHEADVVLGEEVRGSWLFCAFKIHQILQQTSRVWSLAAVPPMSG